MALMSSRRKKINFHFLRPFLLSKVQKFIRSFGVGWQEREES
jgi:hypothetical protein